MANEADPPNLAPSAFEYVMLPPKPTTVVVATAAPVENAAGAAGHWQPRFVATANAVGCDALTPTVFLAAAFASTPAGTFSCL